MQKGLFASLFDLSFESLVATRIVRGLYTLVLVVFSLAAVVVLVRLKLALPGSIVTKSSRPRAASASRCANRTFASATGLVSPPVVMNAG